MHDPCICSTHERKVFAVIKDPRELTEIHFVDDWDLGRDRIIGILFIPKQLRDARPIANMFIEHTMVHPDLRTNLQNDPWAEEREKKRKKAKRDWPGRFIYPVETIIPALTPDGQLAWTEDGKIPILQHELHYAAGEYDPAQRAKGFRPQKGGEA